MEKSEAEGTSPHVTDKKELENVDFQQFSSPFVQVTCSICLASLTALVHFIVLP